MRRCGKPEQGRWRHTLETANIEMKDERPGNRDRLLRLACVHEIHDARSPEAIAVRRHSRVTGSMDGEERRLPERNRANYTNHQHKTTRMSKTTNQEHIENFSRSQKGPLRVSSASLLCFGPARVKTIKASIRLTLGRFC